MRKGCFSRYQLLTVSNLAKVSVRCTGLLQGQDCQCIWPNFRKIAKSQNLVSKEPPVSHAEKPPIHSLVWHKYIKVCVILASTKLRRITFVCHVLHQRHPPQFSCPWMREMMRTRRLFLCTGCTAAELLEGSNSAAPQGTPTPPCGEFVGGLPGVQFGLAGGTTRASVQ